MYATEIVVDQPSISELIVISIIVTMEIIVFYHVPILLIYFILLNVLILEHYLSALFTKNSTFSDLVL